MILFICNNRMKLRQIGVNYIDENTEDLMKILHYDLDAGDHAEKRLKWMHEVFKELIYRIKFDIDLIKMGYRKFQQFRFFEKFEFAYLHKNTGRDFKAFCKIVCKLHDHLVILQSTLSLKDIMVFNAQNSTRELIDKLEASDIGKSLFSTYREVTKFFFEHIRQSMKQYFNEAQY